MVAGGAVGGCGGTVGGSVGGGGGVVAGSTVTTGATVGTEAIVVGAAVGGGVAVVGARVGPGGWVGIGAGWVIGAGVGPGGWVGFGGAAVVVSAPLPPSRAPVPVGLKYGRLGTVGYGRYRLSIALTHRPTSTRTSQRRLRQ